VAIDRVAPARERLVDVRASAVFCTGDSVLVVLALDRAWGAGLALRTPFPGHASRTLTVGPALGADGSAVIALRAVGDSVRSALVLSSGRMTLAAGRGASGSFAAALPPRDSGSGPQRFAGAFRDLPTTDSAAACGAGTRTP